MFLQVDAYQTLLSGVKGDSRMKQLSADFIPKFFHHYPDDAEVAINAQVRMHFPLLNAVHIVFWDCTALPCAGEVGWDSPCFFFCCCTLARLV